ncbi:MAG: MBL fold metallo-hydrolase, partial [Gammaproteobacteria bacterium]
MLTRKLTIAAIAAILCSGFSTSSFAQGMGMGMGGGEPEREIVNVTGDLYRFRQVRHIGVFLVTDEGIILVDPTFPEMAAWVKEQLDERFGVPVRYVIYSHSHNDHAGGGDVFADTATFLGHENMVANLQRPADDAPLLPREQLRDLNGDGLLQDGEAFGVSSNNFARWDADGNGGLNRAEIWSSRFGGPTVRPPDIVYSDHASVTLGGKTVELIYTGRNHTDDMTVVYFPEERAIYTVDFLTPNRPA